MLYGEDDMKLKQSKGSVVFSMFVFIMLFNLSIGIVNSSSLFTAFLDTDAWRKSRFWRRMEEYKWSGL